MEAFAVRVIKRQSGRQEASRRTLRVPWECAIGEFEALSDRQLDDLLKDLWHEQRRRTGQPLEQPAARWDPYASQIYKETK